MKKQEQSNIWTIIIVVAILVGGTLAIVWLARPAGQPKDLAAVNSGAAEVFEVSESVIDFGTLSMAAGKVSRVFQIENAGSEPLTLEKLYTSCMCTSVTLQKTNKEFGPFGMPGHGSLPRIRQEFVSGEQAEVLVTFDPAAHGPSGVGYVERIVYLETSRGTQELTVKARVTP